MIFQQSYCNRVESIQNPEMNVIEMYESGKSLRQVAKKFGWPTSRVRDFLLKSGCVLRPRVDALRACEFKFGSHLKGKKRIPFSIATIERMRSAALRRHEHTAVGISKKTNGYVEYTRGPHKGRGVHVVLMERKIGRRLKKGECVHHIDEDKHNNAIENLRLMTLSEHSKLHRNLRRYAKF